MADRVTSEAKNLSDFPIGSAQLLQFGKERTDAIFKVHKELLDGYEEASQAWAGRVKSEVELWSELAKKLASSKSVPEGLESYRESVSQRIQMAVEDGRRMFEEGQKLIATVTNSISNGSSGRAKGR
jgi:hypothetical protein